MFNIIDLITMFHEMGILEYKEIRSFPVAKKMSLFYKTSPNKIIILQLFHHSQDPNNKFN